MKIKTILISQPEPKSDRSPYFGLAEKHNLRIDFRPFINVEGINLKEFKNQKINLLDFSAVVFSSKTAIDNYFRIAKEAKVSIPDSMKYFCKTESIAYYLQKYIVYRKRKIFHGRTSFSDLLDQLRKHNKDNYLIPVSDISKSDIQPLLKKNKIKYNSVVLYKTVSSDLSDLENVYYDILVFFSPAGIKSLIDNFPEFKQNETKIAAFGPTTTKAVKEAGLKCNIPAPTKDAPSMTRALDLFITEFNKKSK